MDTGRERPLIHTHAEVSPTATGPERHKV